MIIPFGVDEVFDRRVFFLVFHRVTCTGDLSHDLLKRRRETVGVRGRVGMFMIIVIVFHDHNRGLRAGRSDRVGVGGRGDDIGVVAVVGSTRIAVDGSGGRSSGSVAPFGSGITTMGREPGGSCMIVSAKPIIRASRTTIGVHVCVHVRVGIGVGVRAVGNRNRAEGTPGESRVDAAENIGIVVLLVPSGSEVDVRVGIGIGIGVGVRDVGNRNRAEGTSGEGPVGAVENIGIVALLVPSGGEIDGLRLLRTMGSQAGCRECSTGRV